MWSGKGDAGKGKMDAEKKALQVEGDDTATPNGERHRDWRHCRGCPHLPRTCPIISSMATVGCAVYVPKEEQAEEDLRWMRVALDMAQEAFDAAEVPVGSVFVQNGRAIAKGRNRTNELMNATRHAELEAIDHILREQPPRAAGFGLHPHDGPPGDNPMLSTTLYVTIEPCLMCASALRQIGIQRVVFGAGNERFGGNGTVLPIQSSPYLECAPPYTALGGYLREEAIMILRKFYLTENTKAPQPKAKANRVLKTEIQPPGVSMHSRTADTTAAGRKVGSGSSDANTKPTGE